METEPFRRCAMLQERAAVLVLISTLIAGSAAALETDQYLRYVE